MMPATSYPPEMDFATAERVAQIGDWDRLFDRLEEAGCELGVEGRMRMLGLVGRLAAVGADLNDSAVLQAHLAPVVATGPDNAAEILGVVAEWRASFEASGGLSQRLAQQSQPGAVAVVRRADRWIRLTLYLGLMLVLALLSIWGATRPYHLQQASRPPGIGALPNKSLPEIPSGADTTRLLENIATRVIFALPVLFVGLLLAGWRRAAGDRLVRSAGSAEWSELFALASKQVRWFAVTSSRRLFETLKQRSPQVATERIDLPASVRATLRAGMAPKIEYLATAESLNYVVLVDRRGAGDHIELLVQSLTDALTGAKIRFTQYEFRGRPAFCTPIEHRSGRAVPFRLLAKQHAGERILVVTEGDYLFENPGWRFLRGRKKTFIRPGVPVVELSHLRDFGHASLLTPTPESVWGARERMLQDLGFQVVPTDAEGIERIGRDIAYGGDEFPTSLPASAADDPFLARLSTRALNYASDVPPPPEEIANLVTDVRIWLARTGVDDRLRPGDLFLVLCGLAAFPTIAPGLTVQIARLITQRREKEDLRIDCRFLTPLVRLPWLRDGRMPDWLRIAFLNALDESEFKKIRVLQLVLLDAARPISGQIDPVGLDQVAATFEVAVGESNAELSETVAPIAPIAPGEEIERIFLATLHGERLDPVRDVIAPEAPQAIRERLAQGERRHRTAWITASIGLGCAVGLGEPVLAGLIDAGWQRIVAFALSHPFSLKFFGFDVVPWLGVASADAAAICLATWLFAALWGEASPVSPQLISRLRYSAIAPIALAAAYTLANPNSARMPLLFAVATPIFLWFAPPSQTQGVRSATEILPRRLSHDDWIATTLGSIGVCIVALGPMFLFALPSFQDPRTNFTLQLAGVTVAATSWGLGSRYVRYSFFGSSEGRPTANEQWLDFIAPAMSLLFLAAVMPILLSLGGGRSQAPVWLVSMGMVGAFLAFLTLRLRMVYSNLLRYVSLWTGAGIFSVYYINYIDLHTAGEPSLSYFFPVFFVLGSINRKTPVFRSVTSLILITICGVLLIFWIDRTSSRSSFSYLNEDFVRMFVILIVGSALFWPSLRFILYGGLLNTEVEGRRLESVSAPPNRLLPSGLIWLNPAMTSPWWFVLPFFATGCQFQVLNLNIDLSPLTLPLAVMAGWLCGNAAVIPVLVGSLPFIFHIKPSPVWPLTTSGGLWPLVVLPLLTRVISDDALRGRILGRRQISPWDCLLFALCFVLAVPKTALGPDIALSVEPSWLAIAVGFPIGASRAQWPKWAVPVSLLTLGVGLFVWDVYVRYYAIPSYVLRAPSLIIATAIDSDEPTNLGLSLEALALFTATFFGGRAWRSLALPKSAGVGGFSAFLNVILMLAAAWVAFILGSTAWGASILGRLAPEFLSAFVAGVIFRTSLSLSLLTWATAAAAAFSSAGDWNFVVCFLSFTLLGYLIDRRGHATYARALGMKEAETAAEKAAFARPLVEADADDALAPLRAVWGWIVALGVVYVIAGVIAIGSVVMATIATVYVVGIMMLIAGVFEVISAFQIKTRGRFPFWLALGILYIIAGFVAFDNPLLTAVWLVLILGAALVAASIVRIYLGFNTRHGSGWIWVVVSGLITLLLGIIILVHWPVSSLWTLGIFLSVDLVFAGASWIVLGMDLNRASLGYQRGQSATAGIPR